MAFEPCSDPMLAPLAGWFEAERRRLPWRAEDLDAPHPDPYAVLVSELMLQQTQVATVIPYYERWMRHLPDIEHLAAADDDGIHRLWQGLGYYRRARFLKRAAESIAEGGWPRDVEGLKQLPGIGPYTAAAMASIAFQQPEPALDGNAFRVLARVLGLREDPRTEAKALGDWLRPALKAFGPSRITQSVMELGATVCAPRPICQACPLAPVCVANRDGLTDRIPAPRLRASIRETRLWLPAFHAEGRWLVLPPRDKGLLAGLWRWPAVEAEIVEEGNQVAEAVEAYSATTIRRWRSWTQVYSHRREVVEPIAIELETPFEAAEVRWVGSEELVTLPMGRRDQKLRALLDGPSGVAAGTIPVQELLRRIMALQP